MSNLSFDGDNLSPEQLPIPTGWQVLLAPIKIEEKTSGGIIITRDDQKILESVRFIAKVLAIGPLAYTGDKYKEHPDQNFVTPWCKIGDIVSTGAYAGTQLKCATKDGFYYLRMVSDDEIKAVIPDTEILDV